MLLKVKPGKSAKLAKPLEPVKWFQGLPSAVRVALLGLILLGLGVLLGWAVAMLSHAALPPPVETRAAGMIVMISGRDDHGLLQEAVVSLFRAPDDNTVAARAGDGSFAHVVEQRGEWIRVQLLGNPEAVGWVNDYYLRGRVLRTDVGKQVDLAAAREVGGRVYIGVRDIGEPEATPVWVDPAVLKEVGAHIDR